ncbi:MAG: hypothetical protein Q4C20_00760 [Erysipelotrichaceae bacterium]|nr:hypothetical protein [Erysipelotrichaceae bacterium]
MNRRKLVITTQSILNVSIFLWSLTDIFAYATFFGDFEITKIIAYAFGRIGLRVICILCMLIKQKKASELFKSLVIIALAEITNRNATTRIFIPIMYLLAVGKDVDDTKIIKTLLTANILAFSIVFFSSLIGIVPKTIYYASTGADRYVLGFRTANTGPIILFQIASAVWLLYRNSKFSYITAGFAFLISYFLCNSRTASILSLSLFLLEIFWWITINQKSKLLKKMVWKVMYGIGILASLVSILSIAIATKWIDASSLNELFSGRIFLMQKYFTYYGLTLWGQRVLTGAAAHQYGLSTLDNSYVYMLLSYGLVLFLLFIYYFIRVILTYRKEHKSQRLAVIIMYAIYGFSETVTIRFVYNYSLIFLKDVIWKSKKIYTGDVVNENSPY